jgi:hypothetical protein
MHIKARMPPTPAKFYHKFNLRDLSQIGQGIIQVLPETVNPSELVKEIWAHEC